MNKKIIICSAIVGAVSVVAYCIVRKRRQKQKSAEDAHTKKVLMFASVASMIDLFNSDNIEILESLGYQLDVATNFSFGSITSQERVDEYKKELKARDIGVYNIPTPRSLFMVKEMIVSYRMIKELAKRGQYDIVHCHSPIGGVLCRLACRKSRRTGTKVIYTAHGFHFYKGAKLKAWLLYYPVEWICSWFTDLIVTINEEDFKAAQRFHTCKVEYVPGIGIHLDEIIAAGEKIDRESKRSEFGYKPSDFVFMSTGQISYRKNHEVVIRAFGELKKRGELENIKYLIVGFGEEEERLKRLVGSFGLESVVTFAGYRSDVKELLHCVNAFVFPSRQEGLSVALMEAMAVGLPIIASWIRGNVDLIEDGVNGWLVECDDYTQLAKDIKKVAVLNKCQIANMKVDNQRKIQNYDFSKVNIKMTEIYKSIGSTNN